MLPYSYNLKNIVIQIIKQNLFDKLRSAHYEQLPFEIPKSWIWTTLGDIITIKSGDSIKVRDHQNGYFPIYGGNGITGYSDAYNIDKPTIVIGRVGFYCGSIHFVNQKAWITDNAFITTIKNNICTTDFLVYILDYIQLRKYSNSTAQPVISGKSIYPIPIPPLDEQKRIVNAIQSAFIKLETIMESL